MEVKEEGTRRTFFFFFGGGGQVEESESFNDPILLRLQ